MMPFYGKYSRTSKVESCEGSAAPPESTNAQDAAGDVLVNVPEQLEQQGVGVDSGFKIAFASAVATAVIFLLVASAFVSGSHVGSLTTDTNSTARFSLGEELSSGEQSMLLPLPPGDTKAPSPPTTPPATLAPPAPSALSPPMIPVAPLVFSCESHGYLSTSQDLDGEGKAWTLCTLGSALLCLRAVGAGSELCNGSKLDRGGPEQLLAIEPRSFTESRASSA
jgi:hypothetical protein